MTHVDSEMRPEIADLAVPVDDVSPLPGNPRRGNVDAIADSLRVHGQFRPVLVQRSTGNIIAGNHTWQAARQLGWSHVAVQFLDVTDEASQRIALADNRTGDLANWDDWELRDVLQSLPDLDGTGFTSDYLESFHGSGVGGVHPGRWARGGSVEAGSSGGASRAAVADSGAAHVGDRGRCGRASRAAGCGRGGVGGTFVYDDEGGDEAGCGDGDVGGSWRVPG